MLIALDHQFKVLSRAVAHANKKGKQRSVLDHRKIALLFLHHRGQHRLRELQKIGVKFAQKGSGTLDQIRDLGQQLVVRRNLALYPGCQPARISRDAFAPLGRFKHHAVLRQQRHIGARLGHFKRLRMRRAQRARLAPGGQPGVFKRQAGTSQQREQPAYRAREGHRVGPRQPAHAALKTQPVQNGRRNLDQNLGQWPPFFAHNRDDVSAAIEFAPFQIGNMDPLAAREAFRGASGVALGVESIAQRGAAHHLFELPLARRQFLNQHRQPAWRAPHANLPVWQTPLRQQGGNLFAQLRERAGEVPRRKLLHPDFKQVCLRIGRRLRQIRHRHSGRLGLLRGQQREAQLTALLDIPLRNLPHQRAHVAEKACPLGDADRAARIEHIEGMRAL